MGVGIKKINQYLTVLPAQTLLILFIVIFFDLKEASASLSASSVTAEAISDSEVSLSWKLTNRYIEGAKKICFERQFGERFQRFACLPISKKGVVIDSPGVDGTIEYRFVVYGKRSVDRSIRKVTLTGQVKNPGSGTTSTTGNSHSDSTGNCPAGFVDQTLFLINQIRAGSGLPALLINESLIRASQKHAAQMSKDQNLTHDNWALEIFNEGFKPSFMAQNIASFAMTPDIVVNAWMGSEGHKENILNPQSIYTGIACAADSNGILWWVEDFGAM